MNIKQHIEAGHYERDDKGRALVLIGDANEPGWNCGRAAVLATDGCRDEEIIARFPNARTVHWRATDGVQSYPLLKPHERCYVLLPPAPRKRKLYANVEFGEMGKHKLQGVGVDGAYFPKPGVIVRFTAEYEEPWS